LRVRQAPVTATTVEEIRIAPGLAVDRLGRLVEVPRAVCLRVDRWFAGELARDGGDALRLAALDDPGRFASARLLADGPALAARAVIADVFVRFVTCRQALTPAFAAGPFDALDAVQTARLRDAYEVHLVLRGDGLDDGFNGLPQQDRDLSALTADGTSRRPARCGPRRLAGAGRQQRRGGRTGATAGTSAEPRSDRRLPGAGLSRGRGRRSAGARWRCRRRQRRPARAAAPRPARRRTRAGRMNSNHTGAASGALEDES
jgi:hypothetical protein